MKCIRNFFECGLSQSYTTSMINNATTLYNGCCGCCGATRRMPAALRAECHWRRYAPNVSGGAMPRMVESQRINERVLASLPPIIPHPSRSAARVSSPAAYYSPPPLRGCAPRPTARGTLPIFLRPASLRRRAARLSRSPARFACDIAKRDQLPACYVPRVSVRSAKSPFRRGAMRSPAGAGVSMPRRFPPEPRSESNKCKLGRLHLLLSASGPDNKCKLPQRWMM